MSKIPYNEKTFCIDLVISHYKTQDPFLIIEKAKTDLNVDVQFSEVLDYMNATEDYEQESYRISMKEFFKDIINE